MPKVSVDYMNARKAAKPASGGKTYTVKRNAADDRAQYAALDFIDRKHAEMIAVFAEFRSWASASRIADQIATLAPGETLDDLCF